MAVTLKKAETSAAVLLTVAAIWLRVIAAQSAGGLWRDEVNTVGLATLPSLRDVWMNLQFDSFPLLWVLLIRQFAAIAGVMNDPAFRLLGCVIGIGLIASLWFYARTLRYSLPLVSLALFAMNPSIVLWSDTVRGYGFGLLLIVTTGALVWRVMESPTTVRVIVALVAAIASVHSLYYNSVLLLAFSCGAAAVCADRRDWRAASMIVVVGLIAAISLIPYAAVIRSASTWNTLVQVQDYSFLWFWSKLDETVRPAGPWSLVTWCELIVLALVAGARAVRFPNQLGHSPDQREVALGASVTLVVGLLGSFFFLRALSYVTQPWYYLTLLAVGAVCVDAISGSLIHSSLARKARLIGVLLLGSATFIQGLQVVRTRMTNLDVAATYVAQTAGGNDLIVVNPWFYGVTFARYYRGRAPWMTVPQVGFYRYHRYDLIKQQMTRPDQRLLMVPLEDAISFALQSGNRVFVVGDLRIPPPGQIPQILPPAPRSGDFRPENRYDLNWSMQTGYFLQHHSTRITVLRHQASEGVSHFENSAVVVVTGWRP